MQGLVRVKQVKFGNQGSDKSFITEEVRRHKTLVVEGPKPLQG